MLRFVSDFPPPPHPAGLAMRYFAERLPQVIPAEFAGAVETSASMGGLIMLPVMAVAGFIMAESRRRHS